MGDAIQKMKKIFKLWKKNN